MMLTPRRTEVLHVIRDGITAGSPPTYQELADALGVTRTTAFSHVDALERDGYVKRVERARHARSGRTIELTRKGKHTH